MIHNACVQGLDVWGPNYINYTQRNLCQKLGGLLFFGQRWFYKQERRSDGWHTVEHTPAKFSEQVATNNDVNRAASCFAVYNDESPESLGAALDGDEQAIGIMNSNILLIKAEFPNATIGMYGPRVGQDFEEEIERWRVLMPRLNVQCWCPSLRQLGKDRERFLAMFELCVDLKVSVRPYVYAPYDWEYAHTVFKTWRDQDFLAWDPMRRFMV